MDDWFEELAIPENPSTEELQLFVKRVNQFLYFVVENRGEFGFLWEDDPALWNDAMTTMREDVAPSLEALARAVPEVSAEQRRYHGLSGAALRFKFRVLASLGRGWSRVRGKLTVRGWLKQMFDAIDALLDSLIAAAGGVGGAAKECKDALSALIKTD